MSSLRLEFVSFEEAAFEESLRRLVSEGRRNICFRPFNDFAFSFVEKNYDLFPEATFFAADVSESIGSLPNGVEPLPNQRKVDAYLICVEDAESLSRELLNHLDMKDGVIIAPKTPYFNANRPLYLITIPKSGTHLLYRLADSLGFKQGGCANENPIPGHWHFPGVERNTHMGAREFLDFSKSSRNLYDPFINMPALFLYRDPRDILLSEADFYHQDGKSAFWSYLSSLSLNERIIRLINDQWLLGSIRDRIGAYLAWLDLGNIIPISYEELVGTDGGGENSIRNQLIWSLQLKLHCPGDPETIGETFYDRSSPTYNQGQIGRHRKAFSNHIRDAFNALPQDFMEILGYHSSGDKLVSNRVEEFRKRPLTLSQANHETTPISMKDRFFNYNLVMYKQRFYGIPIGSGEMNLTELSPEKLSTFPNAESLKKLEENIVREEPMFLSHNILRFKDRYYCLPVASEDIDLAKLSSDELSNYLNARTFDEIRHFIIGKQVIYGILHVLAAKLRSMLNFKS